ncbi:polysaccharide deacetylase family protein [Specibacter cremeus]|uniref:polysaccharide deacetylase family protein n=1 Tax=Specibacter cremeus TaxID=1629051 RepID=UPI001F0C527C|nr:polysaccharide deacetylase family protein [Specibacter cremeus]
MYTKGHHLRLIPAALAALALAACTVLPVEGGTSPSATAVAKPKAVVGQPVSVVSAGATALRTVTLRSTGKVPVDARWTYVDGATKYNAALDAGLLHILDGVAGGRYEPSVPGTARGPLEDGLKLDQQAILARGNLFGTRLVESRMVRGNATGITTSTTFTDLANGAVHHGPDLVAAGSVDALRTLLGDALDDAGVPAAPTRSPRTPATAVPSTTIPSTAAPSETATGSATPTHRSPDRAELLAGAAFGDGGDLVVPLSADPRTGIALPAATSVHVPAVLTGSLLSPVGRAVQAASSSAAPFTPPKPGVGTTARHVNCDLVPCVALTYDDGPNPQTTRLLGILARHDVLATFFEQGINVLSYPAIAKAVAAAGHVIGNHTFNHPYLTSLSAAGISGQIQGATAAIKSATGVTPGYLRPPYGASNGTVLAVAGMPIVNWSVDSQDWLSRDKRVFVPRVLDLVRPGAVILQHDVHAATVDGQDELITALQDRGYQLVTIPQLFAGIPMDPGASFFCRGSHYPCTPGR